MYAIATRLGLRAPLTRPLYPALSSARPAHPAPRPALQVEEEAIDLTCKPEFTEVNEGTTALRMLLLVEQT